MFLYEEFGNFFLACDFFRHKNFVPIFFTKSRNLSLLLLKAGARDYRQGPILGTCA